MIRACLLLAFSIVSPAVTVQADYWAACMAANTYEAARPGVQSELGNAQYQYQSFASVWTNYASTWDSHYYDNPLPSDYWLAWDYLSDADDGKYAAGQRLSAAWDAYNAAVSYDIAADWWMSIGAFDNAVIAWTNATVALSVAHSTISVMTGSFNDYLGAADGNLQAAIAIINEW